MTFSCGLKKVAENLAEQAASQSLLNISPDAYVQGSVLNPSKETGQARMGSKSTVGDRVFPQSRRTKADTARGGGGTGQKDAVVYGDKSRGANGSE